MTRVFVFDEPRPRSVLAWRLPAAAASLLVLAAGCGGEDWQAETVPTTGRITINGQPPEGAVVELHARGRARDVRNSRPWAIVQDDGTFTLTTYETGDGAPPGDYVVTVKWPPDVTQPSLADRLGGAYARPETSQWSVTVSDEPTELPPLVIDGARVASKEDARPPRSPPPGPMTGPN